jgi:hypothetical protein
MMDYEQQLRCSNRRTALLLCAIVALFFAGVIAKYLWLVR